MKSRDPRTSKPDTRDLIIEAAFVVFGANPGASILDVAKSAGVGRATLYRYFPDRADLMRSLAIAAYHELDQAVDEATKGATSHLQGLELAMAAMVPLANRQWFLAMEPVQHDPEIAAMYQSGMDELHETIKAACAEGAINPELPIDWIAEVYDGLIYAAWVMVRKSAEPADQAAKLAWRTFLNGAGAK
jgi:AcrR family transcriptional regulator